MRILVISDSHGRRSALDEAASVCEGRDAPELVVHLGDYWSDARYLRERVRQTVIATPGNCDWVEEQEERVVQLGGVSSLICHGHTLHVKQTLLPLVCRAREVQARVALYGHTHVQRMEYADGVLLLNPGALKDGKCAVLEIEQGEIRGELTELTKLC